MKIGNREIGIEKLPFVIAEMSANHNGKIETAFQTPVQFGSIAERN